MPKFIAENKTREQLYLFAKRNKIIGINTRTKKADLIKSIKLWHLRKTKIGIILTKVNKIGAVRKADIVKSVIRWHIKNGTKQQSFQEIMDELKDFLVEMDNISDKHDIDIEKTLKKTESVVKDALITEILFAGKGYKIYDIDLEKVTPYELQRIRSKK